jgi:hypothetical protein
LRGRVSLRVGDGFRDLGCTRGLERRPSGDRKCIAQSWDITQPSPPPKSMWVVDSHNAMSAGWE